MMTDMTPKSLQRVDCGISQDPNPAFMIAQRELLLHYKDGYKFFGAHAETLTRRFSDPDKITSILIVHPDTPHIRAVAAADDHKLGHTKSQRSDCRRAVRTLQNIRQRLIDEGGDDCASRVIFKGQDNVPSWHGQIGDDTAHINLYTTRPYRGTLPSLTAYKAGPDDGFIYRSYRADMEAMLNDRVNDKPLSRDLWSYKLPKSLRDLRR